MTEAREDMRVALLRVTNTRNDPAIAQAIAQVNTVGQATERSPMTSVDRALASLNIEQLKNLDDTLAMNNYKFTTQCLGKLMFPTHAAVVAGKIGELTYVKEAFTSMGDLVITSQYYTHGKPDMPKFKDDVRDAMLRVAGEAGRAEASSAMGE